MESVTKDIVFRAKFMVDPAASQGVVTAADACTKAQQQLTSAIEHTQAAQAKFYKEAATAAQQQRDAVTGLNRAYREQAAGARDASAAGKASFSAILDGALGLARGLVALKVAKEENLEAAVRMLAKFQGVSDFLKGTIKLLAEAQKAWLAYNTVAAAASATRISMPKAALAGAAGEAAAGAAMRGAGYAAFGAGAGAGAGAAGAGAGAAGAGGGAAAAVGSIGMLAGVAVAATAALAGVAAILNSDFREGLLELVGWTNKGAEAEKKTAEMRERADRAMQHSRESFANQHQFTMGTDRMRYDAIRGNDEDAVRHRQARASTIFNEALAQRQSLNQISTTPRDFLQQQEASAQRIAGALELMMDAEQQRTALGIAFREKEIAAARDVLSYKERERDTAKQMADDAAQRVLSAEQKLAQLSPHEAEMVRSAAQTAQSGGALNFDEANRLRGLGLFDQQVQEADRQRVKELGLDPVLAQGRAAAEAAAAHAQRMEVEAKVQSQMVVKFEADKEAFLTQGNAALDQLFAQHQAATLEALRAGFERQRREIDAKLKQGMR